MNNLNYISKLIKKYFQERLNEDEALDLNVWLDEDVRNQHFLNALGQSKTLMDDLDRFQNLEKDWMNGEKEQELMARVADGIQSRSSRKTYKKTILYWAASIVLTISVTAMIFYLQYNHVQYSTVTFSEMADVAAGTTKAQIILPDGRIIVLNDNSEGIHLGDSALYGMALELGEDYRDKSTKMVLEVPLKSSYQVVLSDGTKVFLNSGSRLTYPIGFDSDRRIVELEGEAFFEVVGAEIPNSKHKNGMQRLPFIVKSTNQTIEVLGTKFNVSAYADQKYTKTALLEGKVAVSMNGSRLEKQFLLPGQQSTSDGVQMKIQTVDLEQISAWKRGQFYFDGTDSKDVLEQLGRWYGIEIEYPDHYSPIPFYGIIDRTKSLKSVLYMLEKSGLKFSILSNGNHIKLLIEE